MVKVNIGLVGLPSAGKSSVINSLLGKRLAQSGVSRTTLEAKLYEKLQSDDNVNFNIYDLPGIADIEDKDNNFDKVIFETIKKCNIVIWVSDIIKSFITNHELKEFTKIQNYINELATKEGISIQLLIMLSKVDKNLEAGIGHDDDFESCCENQQVSNDEIVDDEETTVIDIYEKVKTKFADIDILCFNAHGRAYHHPNSTPTLKNFVKQYNPVNINTGFNIRKYYDNIPNKNDDTKIKYFLENYIIKNKFIKKCDTTNIDMPSNLKLYCKLSNCDALNCYNEKCENCSLNKYHFACKAHNGWIRNTMNKNNSNITNTTLIDGIHANSCTVGSCNINWKYDKTDEEIFCKHSYNIKKCPSNLIYYKEVSIEFMKIYNSILILDNKIKMIKFLLYDNAIKGKLIENYKNDLLNIDEDIYNYDIWNMLCKNIKINIKIFDYSNYYNFMTEYQLYRIIQIGKDLTIFEKLSIYSNDNADDMICLLDGTYFEVDNIYNIDYLLSGKCFETNENIVNDDNEEYTTEIYNTKFQEKIKEIRMQVFGEIEKEIDIKMIPIAYEKYGLFWKPKPY